MGSSLPKSSNAGNRRRNRRCLICRQKLLYDGRYCSFRCMLKSFGKKMKPRKQNRFGGCGNCFTTALACIFECEPEDIAQPLQCKDEWGLHVVNVNRWLAEKGLSILEISIPSIMELESTYFHPRGFHLISAPSPRYPIEDEIGHTVVGLNLRPVWDPHPDVSIHSGDKPFKVPMAEWVYSFFVVCDPQIVTVDYSKIMQEARESSECQNSKA